MNRWTVLLAVMLMLTLAAVSCSSGGASPVTPTTDLGVSGSAVQTGQSQTHLWGYYDCYIDIENQTVEVVENRNTMFAANVVNFVNNNPANLAFNIKGTPTGPGFIDVNIDVSIKHPFPGMSQYNGYDVRGVFCGDGSGSLDYNSDLDYPVFGTDQFMFLNPSVPSGAPDGYTRWFNKKEFGTSGVCGYTPGLFASKNFNGNATLMPYNYFADGLSATGDLWDFLMSTEDDGVFSAGRTNTRNYYLRFPTAKGVKYGYAILANWVDATTHPANAPEPVACDVTVTDNIYYVSSSDKGGNLIADISLWGWTMQPDAIYIESNMFALHELDATEMTPTGGTETYSTYHVDIPTTDVSGVNGNEFWVIAELADYDYSSDFGVPNSAGSDNLAGFFRYEVYTADEPYNKPPVINSGVTGEVEPIEFTTETYSVDATDPDGDPMTYSWTITDGDGEPVEGYEDVAGDGAGNLDVDWGAAAGWTQGIAPFDIDCVVSDGVLETPATTLEAEVWVEGTWWVSNNPDFDSVPDNGTQTEPFSTITQAINVHSAGDTIVVDYGTGTYTGQVYIYYSTGCTLRGWSWYTTPAGRPKINAISGSPIYVYYTNDVKIQGFAITPYPGNTSYQLIYAYYAHYFQLIDCHITGTIDYYYLYAVYLYFCNSITVKNCKFSDLDTNYPSYTYAYMYFYFYNGTGVHNVVQNEFSTFQDNIQTTGYMYMYMYAYYWPAGSNWCNNLFHHISPHVGSYFTVYLNRIYYPYATVNLGNNTIDLIDADHGTDTSSSSVYGMYAYNGGSTSYGYDAHSTIVSNLNGTYSSPYYYGMYMYNTSPDYCDVYNIQDTPYPSTPGGPNCISADPMYVNNTTEPYDYHLDTGSPCIGTGKNGEDMGCYGNLPAGETIVGLLTPE